MTPLAWFFLVIAVFEALTIGLLVYGINEITSPPPEPLKDADYHAVGMHSGEI